MTDIAKLSDALQWKLLRHSHDFPGPDGGTCINEAAMVVAGLAYRRVSVLEDIPKCFSPVLATYAMRLNDDMPDDQRQKLIPFVPRLAGSRDRLEVEFTRAMLIINRTRAEITRDAQQLLPPLSWYPTYQHLDVLIRTVAHAAIVTAGASCLAPRHWDTAISILGNAFMIGKQAEPIELSLIIERAEQAKRASTRIPERVYG